MAKAIRHKNQARAWQRMLSGRRLDLLDPSPLDVEISDIAHGLARVARWNGQTKGRHAFSVAQHSVLVWQILMQLKPQISTNWQMMALLHDSPEYVVGDMISPFKAVIGGDYILLEDRLLSAIHMRYSLPQNTPVKLKPMIKKADSIAAYFEATQLAGFERSEAIKLFGRPHGVNLDEVSITPLPTDKAQRQFMDVFARLETLREVQS